MIEERELFLEEIRQSQQELLSYKTQIQQIASEKESCQNENERVFREYQELEKLMSGEQVRCEKLDREMIDLINQNQELKLELLEKQDIIQQR